MAPRPKKSTEVVLASDMIDGEQKEDELVQEDGEQKDDELVQEDSVLGV